jgi:hypothetical protein
MYIHIYIGYQKVLLYTHTLYIHIHVYTYTCMYIYIYIYIYRLPESSIKDFIVHEVLSNYTFLFKQLEENSGPDGEGCIFMYIRICIYIQRCIYICAYMYLFVYIYLCINLCGYRLFYSNNCKNGPDGEYIYVFCIQTYVHLSIY